MIQKHITWQGIENETTEHCVINWSKEAIHVESVVEGTAEGKSIQLKYSLVLDADWRMQEFTIASHIDKHATHYHYTCNKDQWQDEKQQSLFGGCTDIDISLSPFTNTLPIRRLKWKPAQSRIITVLYIDILNNELRKDEQSYTHLSDLCFRFENGHGAFRADIEVDQSGFVLKYPGLFEMKRSF